MNSRTIRRIFGAVSLTALSACGGSRFDEMYHGGTPQYNNVDPLGSLIQEFEKAPLVSRHQIEIRRMNYYGAEPAGTMIVNAQNFKLYFVEEGGASVLEYPVALSRENVNENYEGLYVARKATNPRWTPTQNMRDRNPSLPEYIVGGSPSNPLGSRAIYFYYESTRSDSLLRGHGTKYDDRDTIGTYASSGCFRMLNEHVGHLHSRVKIYGAPEDIEGKQRLHYDRYNEFTPGVNYQTARVIDPYTDLPKPAPVVVAHAQNQTSQTTHVDEKPPVYDSVEFGRIGLFRRAFN